MLTENASSGYYGPGLDYRVRGESGGVSNDELITELREVALEHVRDFTTLLRLQLRVMRRRTRLQPPYKCFRYDEDFETVMEILAHNQYESMLSSTALVHRRSS